MSKYNSSIPIKDRDEAHIRESLSKAARADEAVVETFVKLWRYAVAHNLGLTPLAEEFRISTSIISQGFNGTYAGDYPAIAERIEAIFYQHEQAAKYSQIRDFVETDLALNLWSIFDKARVIRRITVIESPEQLGKTRAAAEYTRRNNHGRTVYCKLPGGSSGGTTDFIWALAAALDIPYSIKRAEKRLRIKQRLASTDLLIIDEAHMIWAWRDNVVRDFLDFLRNELHDDGKRGVVLIATNADMIGGFKRLRKRAGYNIGQLFGRMRNETITIDPAQDISRADVARIMRRYYDPGKQIITTMHRLACKPTSGHLGIVVDIMDEAFSVARANDGAITDAIVEAELVRAIENLKRKGA